MLVNPGDGSSYSGKSALIFLSWQNPNGLPAGVENVIHIGVVTGPSSVEWRLEDPIGQATEFQVPSWLFGQAPQDFGRAYVWYIQAASVTRSGGRRDRHLTRLQAQRTTTILLELEESGRFGHESQAAG